MDEEEFQATGTEYRVKYELGGKGGISASYAQKPSGVRKIIEHYRKKGTKILSVQVREVGEWSDDLDDGDLRMMFGVKQEIPDWNSMAEGAQHEIAWGRCCQFPGLVPDSPEGEAFYAICRTEMAAGRDLPTWKAGS